MLLDLLHRRRRGRERERERERNLDDAGDEACGPSLQATKKRCFSSRAQQELNTSVFETKTRAGTQACFLAEALVEVEALLCLSCLLCRPFAP